MKSKRRSMLSLEKISLHCGCESSLALEPGSLILPLSISFAAVFMSLIFNVKEYQQSRQPQYSLNCQGVKGNNRRFHQVTIFHFPHAKRCSDTPYKSNTYFVEYRLVDNITHDFPPELSFCVCFKTTSPFSVVNH